MTCFDVDDLYLYMISNATGEKNVSINAETGKEEELTESTLAQKQIGGGIFILDLPSIFIG